MPLWTFLSSQQIFILIICMLKSWSLLCGIFSHGEYFFTDLSITGVRGKSSKSFNLQSYFTLKDYCCFAWLASKCIHLLFKISRSNCTSITGTQIYFLSLNGKVSIWLGKIKWKFAFSFQNLQMFKKTKSIISSYIHTTFHILSVTKKIFPIANLIFSFQIMFTKWSDLKTKIRPQTFFHPKTN